MRINRIIRKRLWRIAAFIAFCCVLLVAYLLWVSREILPHVPQSSLEEAKPMEGSDGLVTLGKGWFRRSNSGLYEMYVEGSPYERGLIIGKLSQALISRQEAFFHEEIRRMVPSPGYLRFLKYFVGWFNRDLPENVPLEYRQEIFGVSRSVENHYSYVGRPYQRLLNYHAAHDIGHALQNMMLVGCTSFSTNGGRTVDGRMLIGRNFDFFVGDQFARDKIISFVKPDSGYAFMSVTWGGFIGVVSGMNDQGLTVTINAAKSGIPSGSATPVSLVAREILQYASNIAEARRIAFERKMFVSESFLVGSAADGKSVIIEKTPDSMAMYEGAGETLLCTNHFQSDGLKDLPSNETQIRESASLYRYRRLEELLSRTPRHTVTSVAAILRDRLGMNDNPIGDGNEKAINQLIAHHSIIFQPESRLVWVSSGPWQLGTYQAYDLRKIFSGNTLESNWEIAVDSLNIPADPFLREEGYERFIRFREMRKAFGMGNTINGDSLVNLNPSFYLAYAIAGENALRRGDGSRAADFFRRGLNLEIATEPERKKMEEGLAKSRQKMKKP